MGSQRCVNAHRHYCTIILRAQRRENPAIASDQTGTGGENPETGSRSGTQAEEDAAFPEGYAVLCRCRARV